PEAAVGTPMLAGGLSKRQREELEAFDIEKPKKPRNSFFYFRREYHKQMNANGGRVKAKNISGLAGKEWSEMTKDQKEPYKQFAAEDTIRYKQETKDYKEALKKGKKKVKVEKPGEACVSYSMLYDAASSHAASSHRPSPANGGLVLNRLEPVSMLSDMGNHSHNVDVLSYMADMPIEVAPGFEHTPGLFSDSMILSVNPDGVLMTDIPAQPDFVSADYSEQANVSGSMGPPRLPPTSSAHFHHSSAYHPASDNQLAYAQQLMPDHNGAYSHIQQHPQPHHYPQMQHPWGDISTLLSGIDIPASSIPFDSESLLTSIRQSGGPLHQPAVSAELMAPSVHMGHDARAQAAHIDQAITVLNAHQLNIATSTAAASTSTNANVNFDAGLIESGGASGYLTGIHPSIPDIEIVDASNSISLSAYAIERHR
ncbi:hypothetical protein GGI21_005482, partial [Coemansia aciculifera]